MFTSVYACSVVSIHILLMWVSTVGTGFLLPAIRRPHKVMLMCSLLPLLDADNHVLTKAMRTLARCTAFHSTGSKESRESNVLSFKDTCSPSMCSCRELGLKGMLSLRTQEHYSEWIHGCLKVGVSTEDKAEQNWIWGYLISGLKGSPRTQYASKLFFSHIIFLFTH